MRLAVDCRIFPGLLLIYASEAQVTNFLKGP